MQNKLLHYSVKLNVFFVQLCETAITQSCAKKHKVKTRLIAILIIIAFQYTD